MGLPWIGLLAGRLDDLVIESTALTGNRLGDPADRPLWVYVPPGYDDDPRRRYPSIYVIQGYTGHLTMWHNRSAFKQPYPERADALFASGGAPPCIVVYVDAWTAYGGSQFVDSPGTGRYHSYLCDEVVPFVDARYRTLAAPEHRGIQGKSSGGFGAMITPMLRPDLFGGLATHAGDSLYECSYIPEFPKAARALRAWDGSIERWWRTSRAGRPSPGPTTSSCSSCWAWPPASQPVLTGPPSYPSSRPPGRSEKTCGPAGWPGTRCAWCRTTPTLCRRSERCGSTPGPTTSGISTSVRWPSATPWPRSG